MKINLNNTESDYKKFYKFHFSQNKLIKFRFYYGILMIFLGAFLLCYSSNKSIYSVLIIFLGVILLLSKYYYAWRALTASKTNPSFQNNIEIDIDDEGVGIIEKESQVVLKWSAFIGYRKFESGYLLYSQRNIFFMIPTDKISEIESKFILDKLKNNLKIIK